MSKLRAAISFKHRVDEVKTIQHQKMRENIAEPIVPIINDKNENNEFQASSSWNNLINIWEQLLLQEEEAELDAENDSDYEYDTEINEILLNNTHPALDNEAKWNIVDIFIDNLDAPFFINENTSI